MLTLTDSSDADARLLKLQQKIQHTCVHFNGYQNTFCNANNSYAAFGSFMNRPCMSGSAGHCQKALFPWPAHALTRAKEVMQEAGRVA